MLNDIKDKMEEKTKEGNPVVVGAVSAAAGIAIGTAAAMYLSKKENRKKLMDTLDDVRSRAQDALQTFVSKAEDTTHEIAKKTKDTVERKTKSLSV